ncbi:MAG: FAD-dependent oxidoreductase [Planctomycetota bacterium]|jgi:NADPH-dependent glutamate synthase beta subunit-like oxidoreductase/Pyruvate/2-oxoacid:ferredoxin oxidoreductase delta subunit
MKKKHDPLLWAGKAAWPLRTVEPSPCMVACPAGVDVKAYVGLISAGKFDRALEIVRQRNPLPGICGRVCTHPCEAGCNRAEVDEPVAICDLKRFIADYELAQAGNGKRMEAAIPAFPATNHRVAVVGSGPAGLTVANDLAQAGVKVTVFESLPRAGGMLRYGIPAFRLPRKILDAEIRALKRSGIRILTGRRIGDASLTLEDLLRDFSAVFLGVGAHRGVRLGIPGEENTDGVWDAIDWFHHLNLGEKPAAPKHVVVIGGGNSAVDAARIALRIGARTVTIAYRRSREEMPADPREVEETEEEGVEIRFLAGPVRIETAGGKAKALVCREMRLGEPDDSGRRRPVPVPDAEFTLRADTIIAAVSQKPNVDFLTRSDVEVKRGNIRADDATQATSHPQIFAGGDAVTGPATVIEAIAAAHRASETILRSLGLPDRIPPRIPSGPEKEAVPDFKHRPRVVRYRPTTMSVARRRKNFREVNRALKAEEAMAEAARCMRCGPCAECAECLSTCDKHLAILHTRDAKSNRIREEIVRVSTRADEIARNAGKKLVVELGEARKRWALHLVVATVDDHRCRACGRCVDACPALAMALHPTSDGQEVARVDVACCRGCGACAATCITGAATLGGYSDAQVLARIRETGKSIGTRVGNGPAGKSKG